MDTKNIHCHFIPTSLILLTVKGRRVQVCPKAIGIKRKLKILINCPAIAIISTPNESKLEDETNSKFCKTLRKTKVIGYKIKSIKKKIQ